MTTTSSPASASAPATAQEGEKPAPSAKPGRKVLLQRRVKSALQDLRDFVCSYKMIPVAKGATAYIVALVLVMLHRFDDLFPFPPALSSMMIVTIVCNTGGTIGACIQSVVLAMSGVAIGGLGFYILAHLHEYHIAQGFLLFALAYVAALVRAQGQKYFGLWLFAVLMSFNGIYTAMLSGGYQAGNMISFLQAYCFGGLVVLGVNLLVWPVSAEKELRRTLMISLDHIGELSDLLAKTYTMTITNEEKETRDILAQSLRADFSVLTEKLQDTMFEISWSKYSMRDYSEFVLRTRGLQLALISAHSGLQGLEVKGSDTGLFRRYFLPTAVQPFLVFRHCLDKTFVDILSALQKVPLNHATARPHYRQSQDLEAHPQSQQRQNTNGNALSSRESEFADLVQRADDDIEFQLRLVSSRLHDELTAAQSRGRSPIPDTPDSASLFNIPDGQHICEEVAQGRECACSIETIRPTWNKFAHTQQRILSELLATGMLHSKREKMRLHLPQPSIKTAWAGDRSPRQVSTPTTRKSQRLNLSVLEHLAELNDAEEEAARLEEDAETEANHHSLLRVYTYIFAMRIYVQQLEWLHEAATKFQPGPSQPSPRLQLHLLQSLQHPWHKARRSLKLTPPAARPAGYESTTGLEDLERELTFKEAMAVIENRQYVPARKTLWQRYKAIEDAARSPTSIFALKTATGATAFAMLLFGSEITRDFFLEFAMQTGVLTLMVAISPTLGQTLLIFTLQVSGSSLGYLWGVALLEMFRDVGGYAFNPYGIVALQAMVALPLFYLLYWQPRFLVIGFLGLNGAAVLISTEWIYVEYSKRVGFDTPIYRAGKAITSVAVALAIAVVLQVFILRNPARRTVRKTLARLTFSVLSYYTLFHEWAKIVIPYHIDELDGRPPGAAITRVHDELAKREQKIQQAIIDVTSLLQFAAAERDLGPPFRADLVTQMLNCLQQILDRVKEARYTIGTSTLPDIIIREFSQRLAPYRRRHIKMTKTSLHLCASSLASKLPFPGETAARIYLPSSIRDYHHDALLISSHLSRTPEGKEAVLNGELTRFFAYIMTITSITDQLMVLEDACHDIFGDIDSKLD
ncbi:hypothetical protein BKA62DRAFT_92072 [Auriculariales sp. MPI-PUGE-AT-0066]|nr:hypothetical protein BKA62DRAFT_92072 [Auriculariales sp. MPI-PUGE-AT-0066]